MDTTPVALVLAAPDLAPVGAGPAREVDAALGGGAVGMVLGGGMLEGVTGIRPRGGPGSAEDVAEFGEEKLAVGALGGTRSGPPRDERLDRGSGRSWAGVIRSEHGREVAGGRALVKDGHIGIGGMIGKTSAVGLSFGDGSTANYVLADVPLDTVSRPDYYASASV